MTDLSRLRAALRIDEGDKSTPYKDSLQLWTIATGRCLETNPLTGGEFKFLLDRGLLTMSIKPEGDDYLLDIGIAAAIKQCAAHFEFWSKLNDARQNALAEMAYQMGIDHLCGFKEMIRSMREDRWADVEEQALDSAWARETPKRAKQVAHQLASGAWPQPSTTGA
jgi:lysozyme